MDQTPLGDQERERPKSEHKYVKQLLMQNTRFDPFISLEKKELLLVSE